MPTALRRPDGHRRSPLLACLRLLALVLLGSVARGQLAFGEAPLDVLLDDAGLLVGFPSGGLETFDGESVRLRYGCAEWFGVAYTREGRSYAASASGLAADWAAREPVQRLGVRASDGELCAATSAGDLRIETTWRLDREGPYLLVGVLLHNTGDHVLRDIVYTREWRTEAEQGFSFPPDLPLPRAPRDLCRAAWMLDDLPPGASSGVGFSYTTPRRPVPSVVDVPLSLWTSPAFPAGLVFGASNGISWGDADADGWPDVCVLQSGNLWRNLQGQGWELAANLLPLMPPSMRRYGVSFGDHDADGLPDLAVEPRKSGANGDRCFHLLRNLGDDAFLDVVDEVVPAGEVPCGDVETLCWADVDGDLDLDLFLPAYPPWAFNGKGNAFLQNLGPTGPLGETLFDETAVAVGLGNPPDSARPEGAQFADVDFDGDLDVYSNGTLYQNVSTPGVPHFVALPAGASGIGYASSLEEGALFFDVDLDGDDDLLTVYTFAPPGVVIWENRGDGTFAEFPEGFVQSASVGLGLGASAVDWDMDGDLDITTRQVFRRNMLVESGVPGFVVATNAIDPSHIDTATPAWADFDQDGDLDCAVGNWFELGRFYENTTVDKSQPLSERRFVRVRVARDAPGLPAGLETEYGASVELRLLDEADDQRVRRRFVASSGGYLNQDEYVLTFALPDDPTPADPDHDLAFSLAVDFPGLPGQGLLRVDGILQPALARIELAALASREIVVLRSGIVRVDGVASPPDGSFATRRVTTSSLVSPGAAGAPPAPVSLPPDRWTGLAFGTGDATPLRLDELVLDGALATPVSSCGGEPFNVALWDVTDAGHPVLAQQLALANAVGNRRNRFRLDLELRPSSEYRLVARTSSARASAVDLPVDLGALLVRGGLLFTDVQPCSGTAVVAASLDVGSVALALRLAVPSAEAFVDLGESTPGTGGKTPKLEGFGDLTPGSFGGLVLTNTLADAPVTFVVGLDDLSKPFKGGVLVPSLDLALGQLPSGADGSLVVPFSWPDGVPSGTTFYLQAWISDPGATAGYAASNALAATSH